MTSARENSEGLPRVPSIPLADETGAAGEQSIGNLVKDATTHLSTLVRAEVELAKSEVAGEIKKGLKGSVWFILALVVLAYSSFFFFFFAAELLAEWLPRWSAFLIVFGAMLGVAGLAGYLGYRKVRAIRAPKRTIDSMKDTAAVLRSRGDDDEPGPANAPARRV
ncbi:phage holin family protein [Actinophytocola gossypii]|uniref:Phage holin family protein n=1 Tax=Actinophytocola gossypii TaxID=2812003 RepID=A0ABT2J3R2_9PSEU|nr:phage holin family protein [Actinophytocola gossypii]MCT2582485.1 phage holin family protein [Actinophytocola gossypii]